MSSIKIKKVKLSLQRRGQALRAPGISRQSAHGSNKVPRTDRLYPTGDTPGTH